MLPDDDLATTVSEIAHLTGTAAGLRTLFRRRRESADPVLHGDDPEAVLRGARPRSRQEPSRRSACASRPDARPALPDDVTHPGAPVAVERDDGGGTSPPPLTSP